MIDVVIDDRRWADAAPDIEETVREACNLALGASDPSLVILLTDDEALRGLSRRFLGQDRATNVLAFPAPRVSGSGLGDVALAFGVCRREAGAQGKTLVDHLRHLVIHGVLHLRGYDHKRPEEAVAMESLEVELLARLGVSDPFADRTYLDEHAVAR